eukprot:2896515-Pleurochrysis_carterae.AAC.1
MAQEAHPLGRETQRLLCQTQTTRLGRYQPFNLRPSALQLEQAAAPVGTSNASATSPTTQRGKSSGAGAEPANDATAPAAAEPAPAASLFPFSLSQRVKINFSPASPS